MNISKVLQLFLFLALIGAIAWASLTATERLRTKVSSAAAAARG